MTHDIKATVEELERQLSKVEFTYDEIKMGEAAFEALPSLLAEIRRLWAIEDAAVRYREAVAGPKYADGTWDFWSALQQLFASLPPRPSVGEEAL